MDIQDIKARLSVPDLLDRLGFLQTAADIRLGKNSHCPSTAHDDSTGSFGVIKKSGGAAFCCHGCGIKGDIVNLYAVLHDPPLDPRSDFVQICKDLEILLNGLDGVDPIEPLPTTEGPSQTDPQKKQRRAEILDAIGEEAHANLWTKTSNSSDLALKWFESRRWDMDLLRGTLKLGLLNCKALHESRKFSSEELWLAGIPSGKKNPAFAHPRIWFPVYENEHIQYAQLRAIIPADLEASQGDKYVSLAGGELGLGASQWMYNMDALVHSEIIVVEGASDLVTWRCWGHENVVAVLGRSVIPPIEIFKGKKMVALAFDWDEAGIGGMKLFGANLMKNFGGETQILITRPIQNGLNETLQAKDWSDLCTSGVEIPQVRTTDFLSWVLEPHYQRVTNLPKGATISTATKLSWLREKREELGRESIMMLMSKLDDISRGDLEKEIHLNLKLKTEVLQQAVEATQLEQNPRDGIIWANRLDRCVALDYWIDEQGPAMIYTTFLLRNKPGSSTLHNAKEIPYYVEIRPGQPCKHGHLDTLNLPESCRQDIPYPDVVGWGKIGEYSLQEFLNHPQSIAGHRLYSEILDLMTTYLWFADSRELDLLTLYVMATYLHPIFGVFPYMHLIGPQDCGKSTALTLIQHLAFNSKTFSSVTEAHLVRVPAANRCTALFDESDRFSKPAPGTPAYYMLDVLRTAYKRGNSAVRFDGVSKIDKRLPETFDPWGPKVFGSRKELDLNLADRCLVIRGEPAPEEKLRALNRLSTTHFVWQPQAQLLRNKLHTWAFTEFPKIWNCWNTDLSPYIPLNLIGRAFELWAPILTIAWYLDNEYIPGTTILSGTIGTRIRDLMATKIARSRERVSAEDNDLRIMEALDDVLDDKIVPPIVLNGVNWWNLTSLLESVNKHLVETSGNPEFRITANKLMSVLRTQLNDIPRKHLNTEKDFKKVRVWAYAINQEALKNKILLLRREEASQNEVPAADPIITDEPEKLPF